MNRPSVLVLLIALLSLSPLARADGLSQPDAALAVLADADAGWSARQLAFVRLAHGPGRLPRVAAALADALLGAPAPERWPMLQALISAGPDGVPALIHVLRSDDPPAAHAAARALADIGPGAIDAAPALAAAWRRDLDGFQAAYDRDGLALQRLTARALGQIGPGVCPVLVDVATGSQVPARVRMEALRIIGQFGERAAPAAPALVRALCEDSSNRVLTRTLAGMGPAAVPALIDGLRDRRSAARRGVRGALKQMGDRLVPAVPLLARALTDASAEVRHGAAAALEPLGAAARPALPALIDAVGLGDHRSAGGANWTAHREAYRAARAVGEAAGLDVAAIGAVLRLAAHRRRETARRANGLAALAGPSSAPALPALIGALTDDRTRTVASVMLHRIGPAAVPPLAAALQHSATRSEALQLLGLMGPDAAPAARSLQALLGHPDPRVRAGAARVLTRIGPAAVQALPALRAALRDDDAGVRSAAATALGALGPHTAGACQALTAALADVEPSVREAAAWALCALADAAGPAVPALLRILEDRGQPWSVRRPAATALGLAAPAGQADALRALRGALGAENVLLRAAVARALGRVGRGGEAVAADLERLLADPEVMVRMAAVRGLRRVAPARAVAALIRALRDRQLEVRRESVRCLGLIGPAAAAAVPALRPLLSSRWGVRRHEVAWSLGRMGPAAAPAVPELARLLWADGVDPQLVESAAAALGHIGEPARPARPALEAWLRRPGAAQPVRLAAAYATTALGGSAGRAVLLTALRTPAGRELALLYVERLGPRGAFAGPELKRIIDAGGALAPKAKAALAATQG